MHFSKTFQEDIYIQMKKRVNDLVDIHPDGIRKCINRTRINIFRKSNEKYQNIEKYF